MDRQKQTQVVTYENLPKPSKPDGQKKNELTQEARQLLGQIQSKIEKIKDINGLEEFIKGYSSGGDTEFKIPKWEEYNRNISDDYKRSELIQVIKKIINKHRRLHSTAEVTADPRIVSLKQKRLKLFLTDFLNINTEIVKPNVETQNMPMSYNDQLTKKMILIEEYYKSAIDDVKEGGERTELGQMKFAEVDIRIIKEALSQNYGYDQVSNRLIRNDFSRISFPTPDKSEYKEGETPLTPKNFSRVFDRFVESIDAQIKKENQQK